MRRRRRKLQGASTAPDLADDAAAEIAPTSPEDDHAQTALEQAREHRDRGEFLQAIELLEAERREAPDDVALLVELGAALAGAGRATDAERELRRALRLAPDRPEVHHHLGVLLFKRGLYRPAVTTLRRAVELDDANGEAYFYLGEGLNQVGEVDEALAALERAVQFQPGNARAYFTMGILYDRKHLRQEATTMYRKARELGAA
jgi:protein O-GlcNAc transferase